MEKNIVLLLFFKGYNIRKETSQYIKARRTKGVYEKGTPNKKTNDFRWIQPSRGNYKGGGEGNTAT